MYTYIYYFLFYKDEKRIFSKVFNLLSIKRIFEKTSYSIFIAYIKKKMPTSYFTIQALSH